MSVRALSVVVLATAAVVLTASGCYDRVAIPRDKPLHCASAAAGECPAGSTCRAMHCAPNSCLGDMDCPVGYVCNAAMACDVPMDGGSGDGGGEIGPDTTEGDGGAEP